MQLHGGDFDGPSLICVDLQPSQSLERSNILGVIGFREAAFEVISAFLTCTAVRFVTEIEAIPLLFACVV